MNINETQVHALYGQAKIKDKKFFAQVKISVMVDVEDGKRGYHGPNPGGITKMIPKYWFWRFIEKIEELEPKLTMVIMLNTILVAKNVRFMR